MRKNKNNNKTKTKTTYTKKIISFVLIISLIDLQVPFILAFLDKTQIAETLAIAIVTEIIGVIATYSVKAYFENKEQAKNELERDKINSGLVPVNIDDKGD